MDIEVGSISDSSNEQSRDNQLRISSNHNHNQRKNVENKIFWKKSSTKDVFRFSLFTFIIIVIGVLIVCLTSPKSSILFLNQLSKINKSSIIYSSKPSSAAIGDLNNDNQLDIVIANSGTNTIGIFLSNNHFLFSNQIIYSTGEQSYPRSILLNHFNNDNFLDIAVANFGQNNIAIFLGYGNGTFGDQTIFSTDSSRPLFVSAADINNDNKTDLIVVNYGTNSIGILLGWGDGSFQSSINYFTGYDSYPYSLGIADFNNDQQLDIAICNYGTSNIAIIFGYGNGTFTKQKIYSTGLHSNPSSISIADFNNDNELDVVVTNSANSNIGIFYGYSNGTFTNQIIYSTGLNSYPNNINVAHFNNDNQLDLIVLDSINDKIYILPGDENGTFPFVTIYDGISESYPIFVAINDFDNDNQSDIVVANYNTNNILLLNKYSNKPSAKSTNYFLGQNSLPSSIVIYDFNQDTYLDMIVNNLNDNNIVLLTNQGDGIFNIDSTYSTGYKSSPQFILLADLNKDKKIDLVTANLGSDSIGVLLGQTNGLFSNVTIYSTGLNSNPCSLAIGDINNDNQLDIVTFNSNNGNLILLLAFQNGIFNNAITYSTGILAIGYSITMADVNNDKQLDIIITYFYYEGLSIHFGIGNGSFEMGIFYSTGDGSYPYSSILADFNNDNQLDIVTCSTYTSTIVILFGSINGTFTNLTFYSTGINTLPYSVLVIYFNDDKYYDLAITDQGNNQIIIFFGFNNGTFELARNFDTGSGSLPLGIAFDRFNEKSNQSQLVVTYSGSGNIGILSEYSIALFENEIRYLTGSAPYPYSVSINDFNNDQQFDIVIANSGTDNLGIYFNLGNNTFKKEIVYSTGINSHPEYILTVDINKDNYIDIISVNSLNDTITLFMGDENTSFQIQKIYSTGSNSYPTGITFADFNNDNRLDLVLTNKNTNNIGLLIGYDYASFYNQITYSNMNALGPWGIRVADFNHDNYLDIIISFSLTNNIGILLGTNNETFMDLFLFSTGDNSIPRAILTADFNNDNHSDILVVNFGLSNIAIYLGYGNGSFANTSYFSTENGSNYYGRDVGDFNHDNYLDLVLTNINSHTLNILFGYGNGSFTSMITYYTGDNSYPWGVAVNDLNGDNQQDIVCANYGTSNIGIFFGSENGSFSNQITYSLTSQSNPTCVSLGDFNNDNYFDIVVTNYNSNSIGIFLGYGNGSFANVVIYSTGDGSSPRCLSINDFNNDNRLDIVVTNFGSDSIVILFGVGDGSFLLGISYSTGIGSGPSELALGDFNKDNQLDIALSNQLANETGIFIRYSSEPFASLTTFSTGDQSQPQSVAIGDFNNDNYSDIVVANYGTSNIGIFIGYGNGFFNSMISYSTGINSSPYCVVTSHLNNDTNLDIVVSNSQTDNIMIFIGIGNEEFSISKIYSTGDRSRPSTISINDFNNDSILDIIIANSGTNNLLFLYGEGNGTFTNETFYPLGYQYTPYGIFVKDLNHDNSLDIVIACYNTDHFEILIKTC
ncbi:unnamed protein product [Adineta steineri]|uniref:FG-GAP repeat protein n=2 Tax=Adineta steineri TaxID=433720 RepID=A0A818T5J5_9BILA|nr:unnamed protein product [Adineta steineri]